jgi:hypothetical protein
LSPEEIAAYQGRQTALNYGRDNELAANTYGRFLSQQRYARNQYDTTQQFGQQRNGMQQGYNHRNLLGSGIWRKALQQYAQKRYDAFSQLGQNYANEGRQSDLNAQAILAKYQQQQADLAMERASRLAQILAAMGAN